MIFSSYADFRNKFQQMFDGDDISISDISGDVLDLIISAGEQRIYRELRSSAQNLPYTLTIAGNLATLPLDYLELKGAPFIAGYGVADYMPWEQIQDRINVAYTTTTNPINYSFDGDNLIFWPIQSDGAIVTGRYFSRLPDIKLGLNAFFNRHPDVFLYAALAESAPFLGEMTRLQVWEAKYTSLVEAANEQELRRITRGSKLQTRVA